VKMAELVEAVRVTDKDNLIEEFAEYDRIGIAGNSALVGETEEGQTVIARRASEIGDLLLKQLVAYGGAQAEQTVEPEETSEEKIERLEAEVAQLRAEQGKDVTLEGVMPDIKELVEQAVTDATQDLRSQITNLEATHQKEIERLKQQNQTLEEEKEVLLARLDERGKPLDERLKEAFGDEWVPRKQMPVKITRAEEAESGWTAISEPFQNEEGEWLIKVTDGSKNEYVALEDVSEIDTGAPASPALSERIRYNPRPTLLRRLQNRSPRAAPSREYYIDNQGPYYLDENERPVYVSEEEVRGSQIGGLFLAAAGVYIAWELLERYGLGWEVGTGDIKKVVHNQAVEIGGLHKANHHLDEVLQNQKTLLHEQATEITDLNKIDQHLTNTNKHLARVINHDHREEMGAIHRLQLHELKERATSHPLFFGFRYPWDWAANKVGIYRASPYLHNLAVQAANHGHRVQWLGSGRHQMLKVDGTFNTRHVVGVLSRYSGR
jgi:type II secretory pathway component PulM